MVECAGFEIRFTGQPVTRVRIPLSPPNGMSPLLRAFVSLGVDMFEHEKLQRLMREALRVVSASAGITGDEDRAIYWMRNTPIPEFDNRTAMDLVAEGKADAVVKYLQSIESGSSG